MKMEHYKITKLLNNQIVSKFVSGKWIEINDSSSGQYFANKNIRFKTSILISNLFGYSDAYIVVEGRITAAGIEDTNEKNKNLTLKSNAPFSSCISKINKIFVDNSEDLCCANV